MGKPKDEKKNLDDLKKDLKTVKKEDMKNGKSGTKVLEMVMIPQWP